MTAPWLGLAEFPRLETPRLILREISERDFADFHSLFRDTRVNEHIQLNWAEPDEARRAFDSFRNRFAEGRGIRWSIEEKTTGAWVGNIGFHQARPDCVECGLQVASPFWRRGYGNEAGEAAGQWLLANTAYRTIDAWIEIGNRAAITLIEARGFSDTGERKPYGRLTLGRYLRSFR